MPLHNDILDKGLEQVSVDTNWNGGTLHLVMCKGSPADRTAAMTAYPTGNRVTAAESLAMADVVLGDSAGGREVTVAAKSPNVDVGTDQGDSLFVVLVDGSRVLVVAEETSGRQFVQGEPAILPSWKFGLNQPV